MTRKMAEKWLKIVTVSNPIIIRDVHGNIFWPFFNPFFFRFYCQVELLGSKNETKIE